MMNLLIKIMVWVEVITFIGLFALLFLGVKF